MSLNSLFSNCAAWCKCVGTSWYNAPFIANLLYLILSSLFGGSFNVGSPSKYFCERVLTRLCASVDFTNNRFTLLRDDEISLFNFCRSLAISSIFSSVELFIFGCRVNLAWCIIFR